MRAVDRVERLDEERVEGALPWSQADGVRQRSLHGRPQQRPVQRGVEGELRGESEDELDEVEVVEEGMGALEAERAVSSPEEVVRSELLALRRQLVRALRPPERRVDALPGPRVARRVLERGGPACEPRGRVVRGASHASRQRVDAVRGGALEAELAEVPAHPATVRPATEAGEARGELPCRPGTPPPNEVGEEVGGAAEELVAALAVEEDLDAGPGGLLEERGLEREVRGDGGGSPPFLVRERTGEHAPAGKRDPFPLQAEARRHLRDELALVDGGKVGEERRERPRRRLPGIRVVEKRCDRGRVEPSAQEDAGGRLARHSAPDCPTQPGPDGRDCLRTADVPRRGVARGPVARLPPAQLVELERVPPGQPADALVERLASLEEAVGEPVDDRRGLRRGPAREQPHEILELRREMEDAARLGQEERPSAELVDRQEPAACALVPQGDRERPAETA